MNSGSMEAALISGSVNQCTTPSVEAAVARITTSGSTHAAHAAHLPVPACPGRAGGGAGG